MNNDELKILTAVGTLLNAMLNPGKTFTVVAVDRLGYLECHRYLVGRNAAHEAGFCQSCHFSIVSLSSVDSEITSDPYFMTEFRWKDFDTLPDGTLRVKKDSTVTVGKLSAVKIQGHPHIT